jgi:hypothetical protein
VIVDGDKTSGADVGTHGACRVGGDQHRNAEFLHESNRQTHRVGIARLVVMRAALEQQHPLAFESACYELARMAGDAAPREMRNLRIRQAHRIADLVDERAEPRAEHEGCIEMAIEAAGAHELNRFLNQLVHRHRFRPELQAVLSLSQ